jgi:hypothetical protein
MELPFKNGYELAQHFGYGDLYAAAEIKDQENEEMVENIKKMMNKINEVDKRNIQDKID